MGSEMCIRDSPTEAPLLPKLRGQFAEFLNQSSPDRLGILYLPTCVGLGYGHCANSLEVFLGSMGSVTSPETARHRISRLMPDGFAYRTLYMLTPEHPSVRVDLPSCVTPSLFMKDRVGSPEGSPLADWIRDWRDRGGTGISTGLPWHTPLGLGLGPD